MATHRLNTSALTIGSNDPSSNGELSSSAPIANYADANSRIEFADIDQPMIGTDDKPIKDLFAKDGLHLNEKGYEVWTKVVKKYLKSN